MCVTQQFQNFDFQWMIPVQIMIFASNSQFLNCWNWGVLFKAIQGKSFQGLL